MINILDKQVHIYSVDTSFFYNDEEYKIHKRLNKLYLLRQYLKNKDNKEHIKKVNKMIKKTKHKLYNKFKVNKGLRYLRSELLSKYHIISIFESTLTRTLGINTNEISKDIMVVQTYFFDIIEDIILNGFMYNGEKYICFTASAGQIRTKKTVFIKESVWNKYSLSLMCGLTIEKINSMGGVNINKYLAYLALCNSATDHWYDFNIDKTIVVEDMETIINKEVDFIDDRTYQITRQKMDVKVNHTDGCGMVLPSVSDKSIMIRMPWIKGLIVPFDYNAFISEHNCSPIVTDIYGKKHDIQKEKIEIIFTKSQFKMWKYYKDWQEYKDNFIKYNCQAGKCNEEEDSFNCAKFNYQMLQTLTDMTDEELKTISQKTIFNIMHLGTNTNVMFRVLGVTKHNINKNYLQQALEIYPELLRDTYSEEILKQTKKKLVKEGRAGKLDIEGKYTFICPDLYAFCEFLFLGNSNPNGLLSNGEIYCSIYPDKPKLDCLRSPHLYREHAVRNNVFDNEMMKWFITNGLYTSCHDLISKILMFDVDGDKSLVCADDTIIKVAERNTKSIVPLYYNMAKAGAEKITAKNIYKGLKTAYTGGYIGIISNNITKIWNSDNVNVDVIKLLCMENNFVIDYAKTLYKPVRPDNLKDIMTFCTSKKVPHFFIYAKDKSKHNVEKINNSTINRLNSIIPNPYINYNAAGLRDFDYTMLMWDSNVELDQRIVDKYTELDLKKHFMINRMDDKYNNIVYLYQDIRMQILSIDNNINHVVDVLVKHLYQCKKSSYKTTLWECFGDVLVQNLKNNVSKQKIYCEICGVPIDQTSNRRKYCDDCWTEYRNNYQKLLMRKKRENVSI